jgi:hypothetical protein
LNISTFVGLAIACSQVGHGIWIQDDIVFEDDLEQVRQEEEELESSLPEI